MSQSSRKRLLWRDLTLFDGLQVLPEPMAVLVEATTSPACGPSASSTRPWPSVPTRSGAVG